MLYPGGLHTNLSCGYPFVSMLYPGGPQLAASPAGPPESQPSNCGGADRGPDPPHNPQNQLCLSPGFKVKEISLDYVVRHNGGRPVGVWEWGLLYKEARAGEKVNIETRNQFFI